MGTLLISMLVTILAAVAPSDAAGKTLMIEPGVDVLVKVGAPLTAGGSVRAEW
jgi:hypothetical protein